MLGRFFFLLCLAFFFFFAVLPNTSAEMRHAVVYTGEIR